MQMLDHLVSVDCYIHDVDGAVHKVDVYCDDPSVCDNCRHIYMKDVYDTALSVSARRRMYQRDVIREIKECIVYYRLSSMRQIYAIKHDERRWWKHALDDPFCVIEIREYLRARNAAASAS